VIEVLRTFLQKCVRSVIHFTEVNVSLALARKYRPDTFDDLIGQEAVSMTLSLALEGDRLSHAYLFSGLRGSGKTSTARIFAKALLCEKGSSSHPCGVCDHCVMAKEGRHMDIIEMDAASNRGIDDIKDIIEHTKYKPSFGRFKIFIVDEVHMLTPQAFNALLKTLEEPPVFVKFILATTDPLKLPATILSRTQHFRFKKIPQPLIKNHLEHILNLEKIGFESEAIEIIARTGAGSLRDSLTLLDQAIVYSNNFVDVNTVTGMLGIIEPSLLEKLVNDIVAKDREQILVFLKLAGEYEAEMVLDELTLYLKTILFEQKGVLSPMIIERFFRVIAESKALLALGGDGEFVLTLSIFKMIEAMEIREIDAMIRSLEKELRGIEISSVPSNVTLPKPQNRPLAEKKEEFLDSDTSQKPSFVEEKSPPQEALLEHQEPLQFQNLKNKIFDRNYELGACFEANITFVSFENGKLTWESTAEGGEKKMLINHWSIINMLVKEIFGVETKIINIAKEQPTEAKKKLENHTLSFIETTLKPTIEPIEYNASASIDFLQNSSCKSDQSREPSAEDLILSSAQNLRTNQLIEEIEMKSSCIAIEAGDTEAAKEKEPSRLMEEPMIKAMVELFDPKKVIVKRKS